MADLFKTFWSLVENIFRIFGVDINKLLIILLIGSFVILVVPSLTRSIAARTSGRLTRSVNKASTPYYGQKGTGIYKNPSRAVKNKVYRARKKKLF